MKRYRYAIGSIGRAAVLAIGLAAIFPAVALAAIEPSRDATTVTAAMADSAAGEVTGAAFIDIPPTAECSNGFDDDGDGFTDFPDDPGCASPADNSEELAGEQPFTEDDLNNNNPAAVSDTGLTGFPTSGSTYAMLSSGDTTFADQPNDEGDLSAGNNGLNYPERDQGEDQVFDLVTMRIDVTVPEDQNCLRFDFRFLSEEFPEFVGSTVNDGFVAEVDDSTWTVDPDTAEVNAPDNFAFDADGNVISVNTASMTADNAAGTTYDGATDLLRASTPITPGEHSVFLSIFDQGDDIYDSTVFLDRLITGTAPAGTCEPGTTDDLRPPETTITSGPADGSTTDDPTPTFEFTSDEPGSTFECSVDGGPFEPCDSPETIGPLADGEHTFAVRAIDPAGNVGEPASRTFTVDTEEEPAEPEATITSGPAEGSTINDPTPTFEFESDDPDATFECSVDGGPFEPCDSPETIGPLADGEHTFAVRAIDAEDNVGEPVSRTFTVDTVPPEATITSGPAEGSTTDDPTPTFEFTSDEPGSTFECSVDGGPFEPCASPETIGPLADGEHTFAVRAIDPAGNVGEPASRTFTVDTPPEVAITSGPAEGSTINDPTPTFEFESDDPDATLECSVDGGPFEPCDSPETIGPLADGEHTFAVRAIDLGGNVGQASSRFTVDTVSPEATITSGPAEGSTTDDPTPTFEFTSDEPGSTFECSVDGGPFEPCDSPETIGPLADGEHTFAVRAIDPAGNVGEPVSRTFTVDTAPPPPPPEEPPPPDGPPSPPDATCAGEPATIVGTEGPDVLVGTPGPDVIVGLDGDDVIRGRGGDDLICAGDGADLVRGGAGDDQIFGGHGDDEVFGGKGADSIRGGPGDDVIRGRQGKDVIGGGPGNDVIGGAQGADVIRGGPGDDELRGGRGHDVIRGASGADVIRGGTGNDVIRGKKGNDLLRGGKGNDRIFGDRGADQIFGGPGQDLLRSGLGRDRLFSGTGGREIVAVKGRNRIECHPNSDVVVVTNRVSRVVGNCARVGRRR